MRRCDKTVYQFPGSTDDVMPGGNKPMRNNRCVIHWQNGPCYRLGWL